MTINFEYREESSCSKIAGIVGLVYGLTHNYNPLITTAIGVGGHLVGSNIQFSTVTKSLSNFVKLPTFGINRIITNNLEDLKNLTKSHLSNLTGLNAFENNYNLTKNDGVLIDIIKIVNGKESSDNSNTIFLNKFLVFNYFQKLDLSMILDLIPILTLAQFSPIYYLANITINASYQYHDNLLDKDKLTITFESEDLSTLEDIITDKELQAALNKINY
jgi:hypothetical protein